MTTAEALHNGDELAAWFPGIRHPQSTMCPACYADLNRVAITRLVYTFQSCDCNRAEYVHLYEQLWHRACFAAADKDSAA